MIRVQHSNLKSRWAGTVFPLTLWRRVPWSLGTLSRPKVELLQVVHSFQMDSKIWNLNVKARTRHSSEVFCQSVSKFWHFVWALKRSVYSYINPTLDRVSNPQPTFVQVYCWNSTTIPCRSVSACSRSSYNFRVISKQNTSECIVSLSISII